MTPSRRGLGGLSGQTGLLGGLCCTGFLGFALLALLRQFLFLATQQLGLAARIFLAPGQFFAAIWARTAESLSGAGAGPDDEPPSAKLLPIASSSALAARKRVIVVFIDSILVV